MTTTGAYVNASLGSWLSGNVYATAYNELVNKLGTDNVKANTDSYTDYNFVVNQDDMTFRLPLLNGDENIADYSNGITVTYPTSTAPFIAPTSGDFVVCVQFGSSVDRYLYINGVKTSYLIHNTSEYQDTSSITVSLQKGDSVYFDQISGTKQVLSFYPYKGNGNLYYKLSNAVTNLELLDASKVMAEVNNAIKKTECPAYIVETYQNGESWYRVWSDGWCEQGGIYTDSTANNSVPTISLLKAYKDIDYCIIATKLTDDTGSSYVYGIRVVKAQKKVNSFQVRPDSTGGVMWEAKGYIA